MIVILMGVSVCGKTSVAQALLQHYAPTYQSSTFIEGDTHHLPSSISKMSNGIPLDDADRLQWLQTLVSLLDKSTFDITILSCSALKRSYRDILRGSGKDLQFVWLHGSKELLIRRMRSRDGHFMKTEMLQSQLDTLEPPTPIESDIIGPIDITLPISSIISLITSLLHNL
jgi:gluconokinase